MRITIDGEPNEVGEGTTVAAAILNAGRGFAMGRGALCGMGVCFECRATVDGVEHERTCRILCRPGMRVETIEPG